jgi:hypothetical protein
MSGGLSDREDLMVGVAFLFPERGFLGSFLSDALNGLFV